MTDLAPLFAFTQERATAAFLSSEVVSSKQRREFCDAVSVSSVASVTVDEITHSAGAGSLSLVLRSEITSSIGVLPSVP